MTKIFISHSSKDTEFALQIANALPKVGISVWIDVADLRAGMVWNTAIQQGLDECEAMIVIISPESMESANVQDEWLYYISKHKRIITVRWKPSEDLHYLLRGIQYIDFYQREFSTAIEHLYTQLEWLGFIDANVRGQMHTINSDNASTPSDSIGFITPPKHITPPKLTRDTIFISYCHEDAIWLERLQISLAPLKRADPTIHTFVDRDIKPGDKWRSEIDDALNRSKIGILLLTPYFLASDFIMDTELPILLKAYEEKKLNILAIAVSTSGFKYTPLKDIQFMNVPDKPLDGLSPARRNKALSQIVEQIEESLKAN